MKNRGKISVFDYKDYRAFLRDWFDSAKKFNRFFSHRAFAQRAGFKSTHFFMLVMQGKRNLTEDSIRQTIAGLKLNKQDQEFFRHLVLFSQAKTHEEKRAHYKKLLQSKKYRKIKPIEGKNYEYYSTWYHPIVRELVTAKDFDGTPEWIAQNISPQITREQAQRSIELLEGLGFIDRIGSGRWRQTSTILSTGPEVASVMVHNYHKKLLDLSKFVMDDLSMKNRDISAMTLGVKSNKLPIIVDRIREFRKDMLKLVSDDTEAEEVAQLNIQFFPVTRSGGGDKTK